jgi:predicted DNA-binding transcriptional regulator AlpA
MAVVISGIERLIEAGGVCTWLDIEKVTLWRLLKRRPDFPRPLRLDPTNVRSRLRWRVGDIEAWLSQQQNLTAAKAGELNIRRAVDMAAK